MIIRCYNCGLQGHKTQHCPSYGPRYPAPGKTGQDYGDEAERIMALFAADILAEHEHEEDDQDATENWLRGSKLSPREIAAREHPCACGAQIGQQCRTKSGKNCSAHKDRYKKIAIEEIDHGHR